MQGCGQRVVVAAIGVLTTGEISVLRTLFAREKPIIGMLHAPPLAGAPRYGGDWESVKVAVLRDAEALVEGGVDGLLLENFGDAPFYPFRVPAEVVAQMTALALEVRRRFEPAPLGINVLRNDGCAALAIAAAAGARFIRVNVLCGARVTDQGILEAVAHELLRDRARLGAASIRILADVDVKHSAPLAPRPLEEEARETLQRGGADALVVSGSATGAEVDVGHVNCVRLAAAGAPVLLGSGITAESLPRLYDHADGFIVGTWLKRDGVTANLVDRNRVRELVRQVPF